MTLLPRRETAFKKAGVLVLHLCLAIVTWILQFLKNHAFVLIP